MFGPCKISSLPPFAYAVLGPGVGPTLIIHHRENGGILPLWLCCLTLRALSWRLSPPRDHLPQLRANSTGKATNGRWRLEPTSEGAKTKTRARADGRSTGNIASGIWHVQIPDAADSNAGSYWCNLRPSRGNLLQVHSFEPQSDIAKQQLPASLSRRVHTPTRAEGQLPNPPRITRKRKPSRSSLSISPCLTPLKGSKRHAEMGPRGAAGAARVHAH